MDCFTSFELTKCDVLTFEYLMYERNFLEIIYNFRVYLSNHRSRLKYNIDDCLYLEFSKVHCGIHVLNILLNVERALWGDTILLSSHEV